MLGVARDVKSQRRSGNEIIGIVVQYGMESVCSPSRLEKVQINLIYKKGGRLECSNYRGKPFEYGW